MKRLFNRKIGHKPEESAEVGLNITAMADIFTVLLVFLLKGFATGSLAVSTSATLPEANAEVPQFEALKLEITENAVLVEAQPVMALKDFAFPGTDREGNGSSRVLNSALKKERTRQIAIAKENSSVKVDAKVMIVADQRAPYETIKTALASAAVNGFTDFKLAVVKKE